MTLSADESLAQFEKAVKANGGAMCEADWEFLQSLIAQARREGKEGCARARAEADAQRRLREAQRRRGRA